MITFKIVLLVVKLSVSTIQREQLVVSSALDYPTRFEHQNLVGPADGRQAVSDDKSGPSAPQFPQSLLNSGLTLTVEALRRLVQDKYAWIGEERSGNRYPLPLPTRELDPTLTDYSVVLVFKAVNELITICQPRRRFYLAP